MAIVRRVMRLSAVAMAEIWMRVCQEADNYAPVGSQVTVTASTATLGETARNVTVADAITVANAPALLEAPNGLSLPVQVGTNPVRRGGMVFDLVSNTSLRVKVRGSDGVVRSATLALA